MAGSFSGVFEHLELFGRVGVQIDLDALDGRMSEPQRDLAYVSGHLKNMQL